MTEQPYKSINYPDPEETRTATNPYTGDPVEKPLYRFFAIDYYSTGEGRSIWLQICLYDLDGERDYEYERFANFVNYDHYLRGCDELTEEEFMKKYRVYMPGHIKNTIKERSMSIWQSHYHFNRS